MKRVLNRYGKVTLASLGGCLVSIGTFLIVLSSLTVTDVARADECRAFNEGNPNDPAWECNYCFDWDNDGTVNCWCCPVVQDCNDGNCNTTCKTSAGCTDQTGCGNGIGGCTTCGCVDADPSGGVKCECT
ncbi:MAG TPA: hypothetical protein VGN57_15495 [Pirellulaceae bacterium]|jgi:hypothetical protein|nr:hypothetical protein [Pirellulaceae bacterium]